jgi:ERCC4-related helicase
MSANADLPVARAYQEELAGRALRENAILAMDTGTGKTLIAVMVLRSKLAAARLNTAQGHRMVRILTSEASPTY